jgi:FkbM family methyltransferase
MNKFYGQFFPQVDKFIYERYFFQNGIKGFFIECGACGGEMESSCKFFEETLGWDGLNIEASKVNFDVLKENRPKSRNLMLGLSDHDGVLTFRHAVHPKYLEFGNGSFEHTPEHMKSLQNDGCTFEEFEVEVITWRSLISRENIKFVDLFVLDVEGYELKVLDGMFGCPVLPDIICIEVGHLCFQDIREKLCNLGYSYDISSHVNAFFVKNEKLPLFAIRSMNTTKA